jgi:hypothetical protein
VHESWDFIQKELCIVVRAYETWIFNNKNCVLLFVFTRPEFSTIRVLLFVCMRLENFNNNNYALLFVCTRLEFATVRIMYCCSCARNLRFSTVRIMYCCSCIRDFNFQLQELFIVVCVYETWICNNKNYVLLFVCTRLEISTAMKIHVVVFWVAEDHELKRRVVRRYKSH